MKITDIFFYNDIYRYENIFTTIIVIYLG